MNTATSKRSGRRQALVGGLLLAACTATTGCQIDVAGQTQPSPYHLTDDVQYYAPGPEFKLANEAAALQHRRAETISTPQVEGVPPRMAPAPAVPPAPPVPLRNVPPQAGPAVPPRAAPAVPPQAVEAPAGQPAPELPPQ